MIKFKYKGIDEGFSRVYYVSRFKDSLLNYCFQDEGEHGGIVFYRCTRDGEPSHPVSFTNKSLSFEFPRAESPLAMAVKNKIIEIMDKHRPMEVIGEYLNQGGSNE